MLPATAVVTLQLSDCNKYILYRLGFSAGGILFGRLLLRKLEGSIERPDAAETGRRGRLLLQK